jgi:dTDP-alpha-D-glucuronic acid decarboxylase
MVTGAAGMIGSHLVDRLLKLDYEVHGFDIAPLQTHNLDLARAHPNFHYRQGDIRSPDDLIRFFRPEATCIYHLAAVVGVRRYIEDPLSLIDANVIGTRNLLALCEEHRVRMLFASTSEVVGRNPAVPWHEDTDRILGSTSVDRWCYSSSKAVCEHMVFAVHRKSRLAVSTVRFFNVYGPRQTPIYAISQSVYRVLRGEPPDVYDSGAQTRCFTYVADIIDGVVAAGTSEKAVGELFNIGNSEETSVASAIQLVLEHAESSLRPTQVFTKDKYGSAYEDIARRIPDVSKAERALGWKATTSINSGIRQTIEWARANPWYLAPKTPGA